MTAQPDSIDLAAFMSEHLQRAEPDLLRSMLSTFVQALMGAEADAVCGAAYGTRSPALLRWVIATEPGDMHLPTELSAKSSTSLCVRLR